MRIIFLITFAFLLPGCGSLIQTQKIDPKEINVGVSYYLPKRPHNLVVTAEIINPVKAEDNLNQAIKKYGLLDAEVQKLKKEWEKLQRNADNTPDGGDAKKKAIEAAQSAEGAYKGALIVASTAKNEMNEAKASYQRIMDRYSASTLLAIKKIIDDVNCLREQERKNPESNIGNCLSEQERKDPEFKYLNVKDALKKKYAAHVALGCDYQFAMNITPQALVPDSRYRFILAINHSHFRDDNLKIKTTSTGLITSSDVTTTDRTGDIIVEIAKTIAMFGIGPILPTPSIPKISPFMAGGLPEEEKRCNYTVMKYEQIVDFDKEISINFFGENGSEIPISNFNYLIPQLSVKVVDPNPTPQDEIDKIYKDENWPKKDFLGNFDYAEYQKRKSGILYRRDETYEVQLVAFEKKSLGDIIKEKLKLDEGKEKSNVNTTKENLDTDIKIEKVLISRQVTMPNKSPVSLVPFNSLPLVTTKNNAGFENGMLVSYDTNQPSSILELVRLPARVVEGMLAAVTTLVQLKIDYTSKNSELLGKEVDQLGQIQKLKDALKNQTP